MSAPDDTATGPAPELVIDLTVDGAAPGQWLTASSGIDHVPVGRGPRGRRRAEQPTRAVPKGQKHAYRAGQSSTACGLPIADLQAWDEPFGDGLLNQCSTCLLLVRAELKAADASHL
jgi:hypothetical protein